jgi:hypothetical protein
MPINLSYIKTKNTLQKAEQKSELCLAIVEKVQAIDGYASLKFDNELLIFVCSCIENAVKHKIDKKCLVLEIYHLLFETTTDDKSIIGNSIDFLCNNKLVKKIPSITKYALIVENYIMNKL